jgi:lincosamide nucleotidyltransferase A/C/D/E
MQDAYNVLDSGPLRRVARSRPVQRVRSALGPDVTGREVLAILRSLSAEGVGVWLAGGWGVDALLGRQTRRHKDLDLVIASEDTDKVRRTLTAMGYDLSSRESDRLRSVPDALLSSRLVLHDTRLHAVDVHPVETNALASRLGVADAFAVGTVDNQRVCCLSVAAQLAIRANHAERPEDAADIRALQRLR